MTFYLTVISNTLFGHSNLFVTTSTRLLNLILFTSYMHLFLENSAHIFNVFKRIIEIKTNIGHLYTIHLCMYLQRRRISIAICFLHSF